ncbi:MAG: hypothetical protein OJF49_003490 [Ktedonobacterales bacterium]|nr:MAG: hypothetical protein OJF49_003490 [Ktedonobacterales bacterium]
MWAYATYATVPLSSIPCRCGAGQRGAGETTSIWNILSREPVHPPTEEIARCGGRLILQSNHPQQIYTACYTVNAICHSPRLTPLVANTRIRQR